MGVGGSLYLISVVLHMSLIETLRSISQDEAQKNLKRAEYISTTSKTFPKLPSVVCSAMKHLVIRQSWTSLGTGKVLYLRLNYGISMHAH